LKLLLVLFCSLWCGCLFAGELVVTFFDVGQGDAMLITTPGGKQVLLDGGSEPRTIETGETVFSREVLPLLQARGVSRLDDVLVSHPHPDHINGVMTVLQTLPVTRVYFPVCAAGDSLYEQCLGIVRRRHIEYTMMHAGTGIVIDPALRVEVFGPPENFCFDDANNNSMIVRIAYKKISFLFTGDANSEEQDWCADKFGSRLRSTILKIPHHGSYNAVNGTFIHAVNPAVGVISCGPDNPYGHPHEKTLGFYHKGKTTVYRTDRQGTITISTDGTAYAVTTEKP
jgi:competence protein ComEC